MEGDGVEVYIADEREDLGRKVGLDGVVDQAIIHILTEQVFGIV